MIYDSRQDFATGMARITAITLQGSADHKAWRHEYYRSGTNDNHQEFERYLHQAMGYKASTVQDWA